MAPRKINRRRPVRKARKVARRGYKSTNIVGRALNPISQNYVCKLKYCSAVVTNNAGQYVFNLNSLFDPDLTGVGHQPYGYDQLAVLYNRYRVIGTSWHVTCLKQSAPVVLAALPANETTSGIITCSEMRENPRAKFINQNPGSAVKTLSGYTSIPSLVGRSKAQYMADDRYQADTASSPNEFARLNILANGSADQPLAGEPLQVTLEFTVEFFDLKHLAQS